MNTDLVKIGIIGGSGFKFFDLFEETRRDRVETPYGSPSSLLTAGKIGKENVVVVLRHGEGHSIPPHAVNYRANLWALRQAGVDTVIALATVGGIGRECHPGTTGISLVRGGHGHHLECEQLRLGRRREE